MPEGSIEQLQERVAYLEAANAELRRDLITERALYAERVRQLEAEVNRLRALGEALR
jgi:hypothetical protein